MKKEEEERKFVWENNKDLQIPPINSLITIVSKSLATSSLKGEYFNKASDIKFAGRIFAYKPNAFLNLKIPCSGLTLPVPHLGPPTAPGIYQFILPIIVFERPRSRQKEM